MICKCRFQLRSTIHMLEQSTSSIPREVHPKRATYMRDQLIWQSPDTVANAEHHAILRKSRQHIDDRVISAPKRLNRHVMGEKKVLDA